MTATITNQALIDTLNWRYATKKFDPSKKISKEDWQSLEESLRLSPSSYGLQPWQFVVVENPEVRKQLTPVSWGQQQIENASHLVVLTHLKTVTEDYVGRYIKSLANERGIPTENLKGYFDMMVGDVVKGPRSKTIGTWASRQAYIAMGFLLLAAGLKHIDSCPIEGIDPKSYDKILGLEGTDYETVAVVALGYRAEDDNTQHAKKSRFPKSEVFKVI